MPLRSGTSTGARPSSLSSPTGASDVQETTSLRRRMRSSAHSSTSPSTSMVMTATPPRVSRERLKSQMLAPQSARTSVTAAMRPGASRCFTTKARRVPLILTAMPSMEVTSTCPPPTEQPRTSTSALSRPRSLMRTEFGCPASSELVSKVMGTPCSRASSKESRRRGSSGLMPRIPAAMALSVPCPR